MTDTIEQLRGALYTCAKTFRRYAELHRVKGTADGDLKAVNNDELAAVCEETLKLTEPDVDRLQQLEALISEESIARMAQDIAIACVDCSPEITEARQRAMVRLGDRLRNPLSRDLAALKLPIAKPTKQQLEAGMKALWAKPSWTGDGEKVAAIYQAMCEAKP